VSVTGKVKFFNETKGYTNYEGGFQKIYWDQIDDFRNGIVYEWRQGTTWDSAQFIRDYAHPPFIAQGNGTFLVKARCQPIAGLTVYSETAAEITIAGNQLSLNLLASFDEKATGWTGTFQNGIGVDTGNLRLGGAGNILTDNPLLESLTAAAATVSGNVLSFASVPPTITVGMAVADTTTPSAIPVLAVVQSISSSGLDFGSVAMAAATDIDDGAVTTSAATDMDYGAVTGPIGTVTINTNVSGSGVAANDTIVFSTPDVLDLGGVITGAPVYYTIPPGHIINAGSVVQASVNASTQVNGVPVGQNILADGNVLQDSDILGSSSTQFVDGWIEIAAAQAPLTTNASTLPSGGSPTVLSFAGPLPSSVTAGCGVVDLTNTAAIPVGTTVLSTTTTTVTLSNKVAGVGVASGDTIAFFAPWQKFVPGVFQGQAWNFRLALQSNDPNTIAYALAFNFQIQLPARIDHYQNLTVPSGGLTIVFQRDGTTAPAPFNGGPGTNDVPYYSVSWQAQPGDTYTIANADGVNGGVGPSLAHLVVEFFNSGAGVARSGVNVAVEGY
jgi:hypothetical protein